jgi:hypothetical protein
LSQLSLVAIPTHNELLSSWLDRTATLHGVRRHHLLEWSGYRGDVWRHIDYEIRDTDVAALARMMRSSWSEVYARTHTWLGRLRVDDVICRTRSPISCRLCADHLQVLHGAKVRLKHWTEAWRIRCIMCGGILSQEGEGAFARELGWHWYEWVIAAADRGSAIVEDAIDRQRSAESHSRRFPPGSRGTTTSLWFRRTCCGCSASTTWTRGAPVLFPACLPRSGSSFLQRLELSGGRRRNMPAICCRYGWKIGACNAKLRYGDAGETPGAVSELTLIRD